MGSTYRSSNHKSHVSRLNTAWAGALWCHIDAYGLALYRKCTGGVSWVQSKHRPINVDPTTTSTFTFTFPNIAFSTQINFEVTTETKHFSLLSWQLVWHTAVVVTVATDDSWTVTPKVTIPQQVRLLCLGESASRTRTVSEMILSSPWWWVLPSRKQKTLKAFLCDLFWDHCELAPGTAPACRSCHLGQFLNTSFLMPGEEDPAK